MIKLWPQVTPVHYFFDRVYIYLLYLFYVCITLKIAHTVDNQNFQTASYKDPRLKNENIKLRTSWKVAMFPICFAMKMPVYKSVTNSHPVNYVLH